MSKIKLSLVICLRSDFDLSFQIKCLRNIAALKKNIEVEIIVTGAFYDKDYLTINQLCEELGYGYLNYTNSLSPTYGLMLNFAAQHATGELLIFHDVNIISWHGIYDDIFDESSVLNMCSQVKNFIIIPCLFTSKNFSDRILLNNSKKYLRQISVTYIQYGLGNDLLCFDPAASVIVVNTHHFLSISGFNTKIKDEYGIKIELINRLRRENEIFFNSNKYYDNHYDRSNLRDYEFYYEFSAYGMRALFAGLIMFGLTDGSKNLSLLGITKEFNVVLEEMNAYDLQYDTRLPLDKLHHMQNVLVLWDCGSIYTYILRQVFPYLGKIINVHPNKFNTTEVFKSYLLQNKITRVILFNPYLDETTRILYNKIRALRVPYYVFERGALPDSWFFDENGFNADSVTYSPVNWENIVLTMVELNRVDSYVLNLIDSGNTLEFNHPRKGAALTRKHIDQQCDSFNKKILFISLQRDIDTVTNFFAGTVKNYDGFIGFVNEILLQIDLSKWVIVAKKHPLEKDNISFCKSVYYMNDAHIYDLLEVSDKVLLLNSGVGVLGMLFNKHVIHVGEAFYSHPQINSYAPNSQTALTAILGDFTPDSLLIKKFIYYLKFRVYSFGIAKTSERTNDDGSRMSVTDDINFYELRLPKIGEYKFNINYRKIPENSPLHNIKLSIANVISDLVVSDNINKDITFFQKKSLSIFGKWLKITVKNDAIVSSYLSNPRKFFYNTHSSFTKIIGKLIYFKG